MHLVIQLPSDDSPLPRPYTKIKKSVSSPENVFISIIKSIYFIEKDKWSFYLITFQPDLL